MNAPKYILIYFLISLVACTSRSYKDQLISLNLENESGGLEAVWNKKDLATAYIFFAPDCPLCINYSLTVRELEEIYNKKPVQIIVVFPGKSYDINEIKEFLEIHKIESSVILDKNYNLVEILKPTVTPEVVLVNDNGEIAYQGAIDDWVYGTGLRKQNISKHYLKDAINSLLNDKDPENDYQLPYGCFIELL